MNKFIGPMILLALLAFLGLTQPSWGQKPEAPAKKPESLLNAEQRLWKGNYEEARELFATVIENEPTWKAAAQIGIAQSYEFAADYPAAKKVIVAALVDAPKNADLLAQQSHLAYETGDWKTAEESAKAAIAAKENQLLARWTIAKLLRDSGKIDEADQAFRWVVRHYTARSNADDDITDAAELYYVAQCGLENARWHNLSRQFRFILNEVLKDALKNNPDYWPAELLAGDLLLEKYNRPDATAAYDKVLTLNPKAGLAWVGKAQIALAKYDLETAETALKEAEKSIPTHPKVQGIKADLAIVSGNFDEAVRSLKLASQVNPKQEKTLGKLAACAVLQNQPDKLNAIVADVEASNPKAGEFYFELATILEDRKRFIEAEKYYKQAVALRPNLADAKNGLGMLYLRLGQEKEGREILEAGFKSDPFNVKVSNTIKVLKHLDQYQTIETDHYLLKYDTKQDHLLAEILAEQLEEYHQEFVHQYQFEPKGKILIEVFNSHEMFSGRIVGLPDLHTIGACIGRVVAMASPQAKGLGKPFHWGRVMRHELTHIFNLAQTDYQCPHWLTEGLAVRSEQMKRSPLWTQILRDRLLAKELLNLDTIMFAFVRPKNQEQWALAYAQSQLYVDYLIDTYGVEKIGPMLDAYRAGKDTPTALEQVCNVKQSDFETGYIAYVKKQLQQAGALQPQQEKEQLLSYAELQEAVIKTPDDLNLQARLAEQLLRRDKSKDARGICEMVLTKEPNHPVAAVVMSRILKRAGEDQAAEATIVAAMKAHPNDVRLLMNVSRLYLEEKNYSEAAILLERGRKVAPLEGDWLNQLVRIYRTTKDNEKLAPILKEIISTDPDELQGRIELAEIAVQAEQFAEAEIFAKDALMIDCNNKKAQDVFIVALDKQGKKDETTKWIRRFSQP